MGGVFVCDAHYCCPYLTRAPLCASQDADECIRLAPDFAKGYSRKGHLQYFMKEHEKALETYDTGLKHDPGNSELKEGRQRAMQAIGQVQAFTSLSRRMHGL